MRLDDLHLWYLGDPATPRPVGALKLVSAGKGVSLHYGQEWLANGFALSEDLPLVDTEFLPPSRMAADAQRAVGAVDDARPDRWGEKVIRFVEKPKRLSLMEYLYYAGDDRFGALGVSTSSSTYSPRAGSPLPRLAQAQQLSEVVAKIEASEPINALEAKIIARRRQSARRRQAQGADRHRRRAMGHQVLQQRARRHAAHRACNDDAGQARRHHRGRDAGHTASQAQTPSRFAASTATRAGGFTAFQRVPPSAPPRRLAPNPRWATRNWRESSGVSASPKTT